MKKHIIVAGVARAGKSTLCSMISKKYGYQHVAMDAIIEGFEDVFPELGIDTHRDDIMTISKRIAPFVNAMLNSGDYDPLSYGMVIDVCQLMPEDYVKHINAHHCEIVYLVTDCETTDERLALLNQFDTEKDYSYKKSEEKRRAICEAVVFESKVFKEQCEQQGLKWVDTAYDRDEKLMTLLNEIVKT